MAEIDKIENQITKVDKLTASLGALTSKFTALIEEGKGFDQIQKAIGKRLEKARTDFTKLVNESDKFVEVTRKNKDITEEQAASLTELEKKIKSLGSTYSTLANKNLQELKKAQSEYKKQLTELAEQAKTVAKEERDIIRKREADAKRALKDVRERIREERAAQKAKYDEETAQIKELLRQQKNRLNQIDEEEKKKKAIATADRKRRRELLSDLARENAAVEKSEKAAAAAAEKQKFFGQSFRDAFSPQAIGKAIASVIKFISVYEILGTAVSSVSNFFRSSITEFVDYDEKLSKVSAVTQASGVDLENLSDGIREVAIQTRFTANEVADLAISLGKLGVPASQIPSLLTPISVAAQATGEDLSSVGEAIIKVTNQFQLNTEQAATTSAVLTAAVNESSLSLESFNTAIGYVGPVANQAGFSFDQTAKALGVLSDNGFSASRAGTGLRRVFAELKKPGVDFIDTLEELADKNIGLEEALRLVGKQGAAQLLVLTQNVDVLKEVTLAEEGYASQLQSTAVQMSSVAGQVELLGSAYTDLRIRVGEFLTSTDLVLDLIGVLSPQTEELGRASKFLRVEAERLGDTFRSRLAKGLKEGNSSLAILRDILQDTDDTGARAVVDALGEFNPKNIQEVNAALDELGKKYGNLGLIQEEGTFNDEDIQKVRGALNEYVEVQRIASENNKFFEAGQRRVNEAYQAEVKAIGELKSAKEREDSSRKRSSNFIATALKLEQKAEDLRVKGEKSNRKQINFIQGQADSYRKLAASLSEYTSDVEKNNKKTGSKKDVIAEEYRLRKKNFDLELKQIEDSQKDAKKAFDFRMKLIDDEYQNKIKKSTTEAEKIALLGQKRADEKKIIDSYNEELSVYADKTQDLTKRAGDFFDEYGKKFKQSAENTQMLVNDTEQWGQALSNVVQAGAEESLRTQLTVVKEANRLYEDGKLVIDGWAKSLEGLANQYDESAFGQLRLASEQAKYVAQIKEQIGQFQDEYNTLYASISLLFGPEQASAILKPFADAIDFLSADLNDAITKGTLPPEVIDKLKKKLFFLKGELKDGLGKDDIIIDIDITPAEILAESLAAASDAISKFNDTNYQNTVDSLNAQKEAVQDRYDTEDEILKAKLENQLITEAEYRAQVEKNRKKELAQQNAIEKKIFEAEQKRDRQSAFTDYLTAISSIIPNLIVKEKDADPIKIALKAAITGALATASYGAELRAINQRKFFPTKFAEGGLVTGPSHEQGGVPFSVQGRGGYEMEGGEYIVNKRATQKYKSVLDQINSYGKSAYKFANGGIVKDPIQVANRQLELLEAIASSNVSMVGKLDKPVRAFVASDDLRSDSNALRIKERNSQL